MYKYKPILHQYKVAGICVSIEEYVYPDNSVMYFNSCFYIGTECYMVICDTLSEMKRKVRDVIINYINSRSY